MLSSSRYRDADKVMPLPPRFSEYGAIKGLFRPPSPNVEAITMGASMCAPSN